MKCPKCGSAMEVLALGSGGVERCTACRGVWVETIEVEDLKAKGAIRQIDDGDPHTGSRYNTVDRIPCPRCGGAGNMIRMVAPDQPHIWFEHCKVCQGSYFDAGELTDLSEHSLTDFVRDLFVKERK